MNLLALAACVFALQIPSLDNKTLAQQLVARYGKWNRDDRTMFAKLGEAGFAALLPLVRAELQKPPEKALDRRDLLENLGEVMSPAHTGELLELLPLVVKTSEIDYARRTALALLAEHGDGRARNFFWGELQKGPDSEGFGGAIPYFIRRPDPEVIAFLVDALDNPKASPSLLAAAFLNLPSMGDPRVLPNLRAARPRERTLPTVADFYHMTDEPRATAKDEKGTLCGLFNCPAAGDYDDLWIARRQNNQWTEFLFTGASEKDFARKVGSGTLMEFPPDWLKRYALNPALRVDSDGDGLTDILEARLGTNPNNPDTDGDGLPDSQDKNPLAGKLPTTDEEKILAAAFESYFGFSADRGLPLIVAFPPGIAPFELPSAGWLVLPKASSAYWGTSRYSPRGHVLISFVDSVRHKSPLFRWNTDRTEATVHLGVTYGAMDGIGYDLRVRKFGRDWFVVDQHAAWFS